MSRPYLDMITRTIGTNPAMVEHQGLPCKLCGGLAKPFDSIDFYKHCSPRNPFAFGFAGVHVEYRRCQDCRFTFTTFFDDWAAAELATHVYNDDYRRIDPESAEIRPRRHAALLVERLGWRDISILDYGDASGTFAERMADHGFPDTISYDPNSSEVRPEATFPLITCFELLQRTVSPQACLRDIASFLAPRGCIVFSQSLQPADIETIRGSWWYIGPRNGHVSIFTADALARLGSACGLVFYRGEWLHGFAPADASETSREILAALGAPYASVRLEAPLTGDATESWRRLERHRGSRYWWTRSDRVVWRDLLPSISPLRLRLVVPFLNQIRDGFAEACTLEGGRCSRPRSAVQRLWRRPRWGGPAENEIVLHTPEPLSPRAVRGAADERPLGLAIPACP